MDMVPELIKFGAGPERGPAYTYEGVVHHENQGGSNGRLVMAPATGQVALVKSLVSCLHEPLRLLYVLVVPRGANVMPGRYEAPELSRGEALDFLAEFSSFLEQDGRHHLWVASPGQGTVVYDRHNLIYAYGPLACYERQAVQQGLHAGRPEVPSPHWHAYHPEFDASQNELLKRFGWIRSALRESDEE